MATCLGFRRVLFRSHAGQLLGREQASGALPGLTAQELARVVIAYEPIWAIGEKGRPATVSELVEPFAALGDVYGGAVTGLLYGGSVNLDNAAEDRKSTRLNSSHVASSYAVFCVKKEK